jgi:hypothetical protein
MIWSEHMKSCLAAQIRVMLFKGPGSLIFFLNMRKFRVFKGLSIDTTHTPPPFSFYTTFKTSIVTKGSAPSSALHTEGFRQVIITRRFAPIYIFFTHRGF